MLRAAAGSLLQSDDLAGVLTIGGALTLLAWIVTPIWILGVLVFPPLAVAAPIALAPAIVVRGYFVRVLRAGVHTGNNGGAPSFVEWNELYRDGVKSVLLSAGLLAPLAAVLALIGGVLAAITTGRIEPLPAVEPLVTVLGTDGFVALLALGTGLVVSATAAYLIAFAYVRPAALTAVALSGRLRDGFRPRRVADIGGTSQYATAWIIAAVTSSAGYALSVPVIPLVVGAVSVFMTRTIVHALYGRGSSGGSDGWHPHDEIDMSGVVKQGKVTDVRENRGAVDVTVGSSVSAAVQVGRSVPFGRDIDDLVSAYGEEGDTGIRAHDGENTSSQEGDPDTHEVRAGFEWQSPRTPDRDSKPRDSSDTKAGESTAERDTSTDRFNWGTDGHEDKR